LFVKPNIVNEKRRTIDAIFNSLFIISSLKLY
jgi:hypothetical protein